MKLYSKWLLPKVVDWSCRQQPNMRQRKKVIPLAAGTVLEIGIGSGLNLPCYDREKVTQLTGIDPSEEMWKKKVVDTHTLGFDVAFIKAYAADIPADDNSFDVVVTTYTLCTIPSVHDAFTEVRRVLKPNGTLIFCEHGKAPDKVVQHLQNIMTPFWKPISGGCHLNRDIPYLIETNGFRIMTMETDYVAGWKPFSFTFWGTAEMY